MENETIRFVFCLTLFTLIVVFGVAIVIDAWKSSERGRHE